jgi:hypothetical protein
MVAANRRRSLDRGLGRLVIIVLMWLSMGERLAQAGQIRGVPLPDDISLMASPTPFTSQPGLP